MNIRIESNFNLTFLKAEFELDETLWNVDEGGFDQISTNIYNKTSCLYKNNYDALILLLDINFLSNFSVFSDPFGCDIDKEYKKIESAVDDICLLINTYHNTKPNTPICLVSFPNQPNTPFNYLESNTEKYSINKIIDSINYRLSKKITDISNTYVFDINNIILNYGYKTIYDARMWYLAKSPFSQLGSKYLSEELKAFLNCIKQTPKKVLVLDLDNTLWGGVVGEDGVDGIQISSDGYGKAFFDFQRELLNLKKRGVLLTICSKNNEEDARNVFDNHPDMILRWDDFIVKKINWNDKVSNIKQISDEINVGVDSIVFIDDNPAERQWVRSELPEVFVPEFPDEPSELKNYLLSLNVFNVFYITEEDFNKTSKYQEENSRKEFQKISVSYEDFLKSLEIQCNIKEISDFEIKRAAQLFSKTNQFNFTTQRYTEGEINQFIKSPLAKILSITVRDKFGEYGVAGLAVLIKEGNKIILDSFLLSCRVLGKKIEDYFLAYLARYASEKWNCMQLEILYRSTNKNIQIEEFLKERELKLNNEKDGVKYYLIDNTIIKFPEHIRIQDGK